MIAMIIDNIEAMGVKEWLRKRSPEFWLVTFTLIGAAVFWCAMEYFHGDWNFNQHLIGK
jgi:hypothetical protein